jgi:hypothetical protein
VGVIVMRRGVALLFAVVLGATVTSCAAADETVSAVRSITVKPRLVVDGTIALADRNANIAIDSLVAHATEARVLGADDVVAAEEADLVFDFAADGSAHNATRSWSVPVEGGVVAVDFGPTGSDVDTAAALVGHTAIIEGTITIATVGFGAFGEVDPDGTPAEPIGIAGEVDPDGTPAIPDDIKTTSEVDPDGTPAIPDDVDTTSEVDPDGTPAIPDDVDSTSEVDPDGTPAEPTTTKGEVDPDGTPARPRGEVDPDGTPARPKGFDALKAVRARVAAQKHRASGQSAGGSVVVPFTLVVDGAFAYTAALSGADIASVGTDELLPIDLRVDVSTLLTAARVATLDGMARSAIAAGVHRQGLVLALPAATTAQAVEVDVPAAEAIVEAAPVVGERMVVGSSR